MLIKAPTRYFLVAGNDEGFTELNAFDHALLAAGIGDTNLVRMSSILPPKCQRIDPVPLPYGALVPVAYADMTSSTPGQVVAAAVAVAVPTDPELPGLIMEHHGACSAAQAEARVREMAAQGMAHRNREIATIISVAAQHTTLRHGAAFAGVVLWDDTQRAGQVPDPSWPINVGSRP